MELFNTSEEYLEYLRSPNRTFMNIVPDSECTVINKVHPIKQRSVANIFKIVKEKYSGIIKRIILFGSAITGDCWEGSDIDLCIDWEPYQINIDTGMYSDCAVKALFDIKNAINGTCDILRYDENDNSDILNTIREKGLVIYDKDV